MHRILPDMVRSVGIGPSLNLGGIQGDALKVNINNLPIPHRPPTR